MAENQTPKRSIKRPYVFAVGRRREAVARVRLYSSVASKVEINGKQLEKGDIYVNDKPINEYFNFQGYTPKYMKLLSDADVHGKYAFTIKVKGGGLSGQLDAVMHGIARALVNFDKEAYRTSLKPLGYLVRDPRTRERRKVGTGGKARRKKQSPKR